ncbi:hypothetical protein R6X40_26120 [Rhizobium sp. PL01]|nr:hypothetical protein [Rhizobium sp. PL01]MDW5317541.1 hypothetical protein [Rhizobium sp. PL01]
MLQVETRKKLRPIWFLVAAAAVLFFGANIHLLYVAISSQPDCVAHLKDRGDEPGKFRAAKPAC